LIAHALGIPAKDVNKIKWTRGQQYELAEYFSKEQQSIRNEYIRADKAGDYDRMSELEDEFDNLQDAKDGVRPFFNDNYGSLKRTSIKSLILAPVKQELRQGKYARELGTD
jgi:predicted RNA-binding protein with EMAP domain